MGNFIEWKPYYSVGDALLDEEHQVIIKLIDDLYLAISVGRENARTKEILDALVRYTMTHFDHEEDAMRACGYAEFEMHKALHDQMRRRTLDLRENIGIVTGHDLMNFLKDWWTNHIQVEDKQYAPFMYATAR